MLEAQIEQLQATVSALQEQLEDKRKNMAFNLGEQMQKAMSVVVLHSLFIFNLLFLIDLPQSQLYSPADVLFFHRLFLKGDEEEKEEFVSTLKEEVEELRKTVTWQAQMNGVSMKNCTIKTLQSSKSTVGSVV